MSYGPDDVSGLRYPNKKWVLFDTSETASIDFSQVISFCVCSCSITRIFFIII